MNAKEMLSQITALLNAKVSLAQMTLENGTIIEAEAFEAGQSVFIVTEDDKVPMPVGDYELEGGKILSVQEEGIIATIKDGMEDEEEKPKEEATKEEELAEEEIVVEAPEEVAPQVEEIVEAVVEVIAPVIEEVKAQVEEMKKKFEEQEEDKKKKEEMSAQQPATKPFRHNPESKAKRQDVRLESKRPMSTLDRVLNKLNK